MPTQPRILMFLVFILMPVCAPASDTPFESQRTIPSRPNVEDFLQVPEGAGINPEIKKKLGRLPLAFEINDGQFPDEVNFFSRGAGYSLFLTSREAVMVLKGPQDRQRKKSRELIKTTLRMQLIGSNPEPLVIPEQRQRGVTHYLKGNDRDQWRAHVPTYSKIKYREVYPGIDLVYYGNHEKLEYDFIVSPGGNYQTIRINFSGARGLEIDESGDLKIKTETGNLVQHSPLVYQIIDGEKRVIPGRYKIQKTGDVGFQVAGFDADKPLIIDPVLEYSTYLGGSLDEAGAGIAVDASGDVYITGHTESLDFPTSNPAFPVFEGGSQDAFVTKLRIDSSSTTLIYSTYLGGNDFDRGNGIVVDDIGRAYVVGDTISADFPVTANAIQGTYGGNSIFFGGDAFVVRLANSGAVIDFSTYLGGSDRDNGRGIAIDSSGDIYVTGNTRSTNFPVANTFQGANGGGDDAFVSRISFQPSPAFVYSTYLGGTSTDEGNAIAVDLNGNAYVTGSTSSTNFPTVNPIQGPPSIFNPNENVFISKFNPGGGALIYSTYLGGTTVPIGGSNFDTGLAIAVDDLGNAYVAGTTNSANFPTTAGAFQTTYSGGPPFLGGDAFVTKVNAQGNAWAYSTFIGGSGFDRANAIAVDNLGNAFVTGTGGSGFPYTANAIPGAAGTAFMSKLNATGSGLDYSTPLGDDQGFGIARDNQGNTFVTGGTGASTFPVTVNAFQSSLSGGDDAFVSKLNLPSAAAVRNDFDGDGDSDLLLVNDNGTIVSVLLEDSVYQSHGFLLQIDPGLGWTVHATGDINNDQKADIIFYNTVTGEVRTVGVDGTTLVNNLEAFTLPPATGLEIRGVGDFDGDGIVEIIVYHATQGWTGMVFLSGGVFSSFAWAITIDEPNGSTLKEVAELTGDGKADLVTYNTVTGEVMGVEMDGSTATTPVLILTLPPAAGFTVEDTGDFDGDGNTDILAIQASSGALIPLLLNGLVYQSAYVPGNMPPGFGLINAGPYSQDNLADFLVYNSTNGELDTFYQDGAIVNQVNMVLNLGAASGWTYHSGKP